MPYVILKTNAKKARDWLTGDKAARKRLHDEVAAGQKERDRVVSGAPVRIVYDESGRERRVPDLSLEQQRELGQIVPDLDEKTKRLNQMGHEIEFESVATSGARELLRFPPEECGAAHVVALEQAGDDEDRVGEFLFATEKQARAALK